MTDEFDNLPNKISLEKLEEYGDNALGVKVIVVCYDKAYCGVIKHVLKDVKRIWLIKCFTYDGSIPLMGVTSFLYSDISFISVLKIDEEVKRKMLKRTVEESKRSKKLIMQRIVIPDQDGNDEIKMKRVVNGVKEDSPVEPVPPYGNCSRPESVEEICVADNLFTEAMANINSEPVVGLVVRGKSLGRKGAIGWISVATPHMLYHFDVLALSFQKMLDTGFRSLLEHPHRVKVIHDSRSFQDYLLYKHKCQMRKVFDIQLTDWYMQMRLEKGKEMCLANDYMEIVKIALRFKDSHFPDCFSKPVADSSWMERPLPEDLVLECEFSASHLLEVRQVMIDKALLDLQCQTDVFVQSICKMDQYSAEMTEHMIIPQEVHKMWQKKSSDRIIYTEHPAAKQAARLIDNI